MNALQIAAALGLTETDRAITSLPLGYCFGLSVVTSHLIVGASVVLSDASVMDDAFWSTVARERVTTIAGVPHTFELLDTIGFDGGALPHLRLIVFQKLIFIKVLRHLNTEITKNVIIDS